MTSKEEIIAKAAQILETTTEIVNRIDDIAYVLAYQQQEIDALTIQIKDTLINVLEEMNNSVETPTPNLRNLRLVNEQDTTIR